VEIMLKSFSRNSNSNKINFFKTIFIEMEENKLNARQRRNLKFIEALRTTGSQSNLELKEFRKRQKMREFKPSRIHRRENREKEWWKIARRNEAKKEAKRQRELKLLQPTQRYHFEEEIISGKVEFPQMIEYKLNKIDYKRKSRFDFSDVIKMTQNDPRNYLYYHQNQEFQRNSDVTIIPFSTEITSEEAQEIYENDILILTVEDDIY
jgi:hypothetical protein